MSNAYQTEIRTAKNTIISDEPEDLGGENTGFSPMELLAASLGSCTAITLRMYAERKKWDLKDVKVEVNFDRDAEKNESRISRTIELTGNLTDKQKDKLMDVAENCPIHKALTNPIKIITEAK